ncbi:M20 aminoacylase family protein [Methylobacterium oryzihabitans]|uniref:Amidohydrolase n=1 Tax=Methylobacterium oryzihabitans TaxID=2499852 RepID=A0A437P0U4_9HYPH|nr:M20 aminoacylase family protein [Methylobacterium oryzihabitans]RVU15845.1 amidohydrolase [Methylobacterium oryzihabitans]
MPVVNRIAALTDEITAWRRDFHQHPELLFAVDRTAGLVAERLRAFGCDEVVTGIGRTGVVGVIRGRQAGSGRTVGLRADMDALPIEEATDVAYRSTVKGKMHACGHDGHTAMLLGAAKYLAETRNFDGTAIVIFQPAEEGGGGGDAMVKDGLMERFGIQEVYGLHNKPGLPLGSFAIRPGPMMAAADRFVIEIEGRGGHAAAPHDCIDTVLVSAHVITALQSIASRNVDPVKSAVVSVTTMHAGDAFNVIPQTATLTGTVRCLDEAVRDLCEARLGAVAESVAAAFGATARTAYHRGYPVTENHPDQAAFMADVAAEVSGEALVDRTSPPLMGAEDFSYMLNRRPGAYIFMGTGDGPGLHHPAYDFNDAATPYGVSLWARLIERAMPAA